MRIHSIGAAIAGAFVALLIREAVSPSIGARDSEHAAVAPAPVETTHMIRERTGPDEESLRRMIREELAAARTSDESDHDEDASRDKLPTRPEEVHAAQTIVSDAVAVGRWTQSDHDRISVILPRLDPTSLDEVLSQFHMAVNAQRLEIEALPP